MVHKILPKTLPVSGSLPSREEAESYRNTRGEEEEEDVDYTCDDDNVDSKKESLRNPLKLPRNFVLGPYDVGCGRGQRYCNHSGNVRFRHIVDQFVDTYIQTHTKVAKTALIVAVLGRVRNVDIDDEDDGSAGHGDETSWHQRGRFVKQRDDGAWVELGEAASRDKVSNALRCAVAMKKGGEVTTAVFAAPSLSESSGQGSPGDNGASRRQPSFKLEKKRKSTRDAEVEVAVPAKVSKSHGQDCQHSTPVCIIPSTGQQFNSAFLSFPSPTAPISGLLSPLPQLPVVTPRDDDKNRGINHILTIPQAILHLAAAAPLPLLLQQQLRLQHRLHPPSPDVVVTNIQETLDVVTSLFLLKSGQAASGAPASPL